MERPVTVGVVGLGRGGHLADIAAALPGVRVVAGCDAAGPLAAAFSARYPEARLTPTFDALLDVPFDVLILASYCPDHGPQAVRALQAGRHVLSEVTAFHTPAEGVALVEAVEASGRHYMMAENTCYRARTFEARRLLREGALGTFVYGQCEYVHDIRGLMHNADGSPHWRGWLPPTYYTTHPLGEMLTIAGARPVAVSAQGVFGRMPGSANPLDMGAMLVTLDNGGVVHALASFAAGRDSQWLSIYGTAGVVESDRWGDRNLLHVRLGAAAGREAELRTYLATYPEQPAAAAHAGHGGSDFFPVYHFLRAVRGEGPLPMNVYDACDYTLPGIMAYRSAVAGGTTLEVPDLRDPATRERYRGDRLAPPRADRVSP